MLCVPSEGAGVRRVREGIQGAHDPLRTVPLCRSQACLRWVRDNVHGERAPMLGLPGDKADLRRVWPAIHGCRGPLPGVLSFILEGIASAWRMAGDAALVR